MENYSTDLFPNQQEGAGGVLVATMRPMFLSLPPSVLAVAWFYRDSSVG